MDPFDLCLFVLVAAAAVLAWTEYRRMRRDDALHHLRTERERLENRKLELEVEKAARA